MMTNGIIRVSLETAAIDGITCAVAIRVIGILQITIDPRCIGQAVQLVVGKGLAACGIDIIGNSGDIIRCIEGVGQVQHRAGHKMRQPVIEVITAAVIEAIAIGHRVHRPKRFIRDATGEGIEVRALRGGDTVDLPEEVTRVVHSSSTRIRKGLRPL